MEPGFQRWNPPDTWLHSITPCRLPTFRNTSLSFNLAVSPCIYVGCNTQVFPKKASGKRPLQSFLSLLLGTCVRREATMILIIHRMINTVNISQGLYLIMYTFYFCLLPEAPTSNTYNDNKFFFPKSHSL